MFRTIVTALLLGTAACSTAAERMVTAPVPAADTPLQAGPVQTAVFAGGCFWGVEGVFERIKGVTSVRSGYAGGPKAAAMYEVVGTGLTGHAEAVEIKYDPAKVSYGTLLRILFSVAHDPTQRNRQGPDTGSQYRSAIFPQTPEQAKLARAYVAQLTAAKTWPARIVTTLEPGKPFFPAENYHQNYLRANPQQPYIAINDIPKVEALKARFPQLWSDKPAA
ncbi:peptide-methionine (S)-S-oxide reductase MsrA [Polymorphobacter fuscus]|uniref:Peptide methionine sulfoxide reductase MsrA n=1 Tax=Sandarakinorhabdus fusca TaxID=1439888 RepID=A0A7C9KGX5_9SPHN|nr:peptide-methionine (S)-S-oxide reductase MsrA [Polymorphobacter fuscus]KAB7648875.1 peptide-methionine (S)-S-oxide reductase MsrA [Polymorphobacter fuscus]MQT16460.1 peptide-methionine (S)-S-oxide reductase MsrA [Polymorphobacter fuscus]NJC07250.1 peptide-methionine (S)-S-oxide reductase [Polymorphobacter fuscus]